MNTISYILLYYHRFIVLFTEIIHNIKNQTQENKENVFNLILHYLEKYSSSNCIIAAFTLAPWHPGLEIKMLYYCVLHTVLHSEVCKSATTCRGSTHVTMDTTHMNHLHDWHPSSVQYRCSVVFDSLRPHGLQHARPPCPSPAPGVYSNSCPLSQWCHPTVSSSVVPFSSCPQSFPASGSFLMNQFFASGGQRIGVSASTSVLPMNIQDRFPLGWTGWISLQSKGLSRVLNTTVQKHQLFSTQLSL